MMGKRPGLVGAARSERDVVRWVSRQCPLGRRSWSIRVVGEEGDEVRMQVCQARGEGGAMWRARREGWTRRREISLLCYMAELCADGAHNRSPLRGGAFGLSLIM
jgi:hypothetical protein